MNQLGSHRPAVRASAAYCKTTARIFRHLRAHVGGVDLIWQEKDPDLHKEPFTLEATTCKTSGEMGAELQRVSDQDSNSGGCSAAMTSRVCRGKDCCMTVFLHWVYS